MAHTDFDRSARSVIRRFRSDAARWVVPEGFADPDSLDAAGILRLLRRHRQFRAIFWFRLGEWGHGAPRIRGLSWFCEQRMQAGYGLDLATSVPIEGGFYIAHPSGTAVNAAGLGANVTIVGAATIGLRGEGSGPELGDRVFVGAGARVLGPIAVGEGSKIGANAVVLHDVDDGVTVVGIPARAVQ